MAKHAVDEAEERTLSQIVGANVQRLRKAMQPSMSQYSLADASGVSRSSIADLERGRYPSVDIETLQRLAPALGVTINELVDPRGSWVSSQSALDVFMSSAYAESMAPTDREKQMIRLMPDSIWWQMDVTAEAVADILMTIRRNRRR